MPRAPRHTRLILVLSAAGLVATACGGATTSEPSAPPANQTPGCSAATPANPGTVEETLTVDGRQRRYIMHVPANYSQQSPAPLVLSMHGSGSTAAQQLALTGVTETSDKYGFVVLAPQALDGQWQLPAATGTDATTAEAAYLEAAITAVQARVCIDPRKRYASGMSLGSIMTLVLACAKEQTFAAFGGVGASFYRPICAQSPPAPLIYFHGTADKVVPYAGGNVRGFMFNSVDRTMADWAAHNKCAPTPAQTRIGNTTRILWSECANNADIDYYRVQGGGHTWPGGPEDVANLIEPGLGKTTRDVSANELMWQFFTHYQLAD